MSSYYTDPCPDCAGRGWTPEGHQCRECRGTGRAWARVTTFVTHEPGEYENFFVKVDAEVNQAAEWERQDRRRELAQHPELEERVAEVEAEFRREADIERRFAACEGPEYEKWRREHDRERGRVALRTRLAEEGIE